jgi:hypothetical protein
MAGVEVELAAWLRADPEAVSNAGRDEDERAGRARDLVTVHEDEVLALQHVERFSGVVMDVERGSESRRFVCLQQREPVAGFVAGGFHRDPKSAEVDRAPLAWSEDERFALAFAHDDLVSADVATSRSSSPTWAICSGVL